MFILALFGVACVAIPVALVWAGVTLVGAALWVPIVFGFIVLLFTGALAVYSRLYVKPSANEAFVRTGSGGPFVMLDKGALVIPMFHRIVPVSLETMKLDIERAGLDALITKDNLRVDVRGEFYIRVQPNREAILQAARSLGERSVNAQAVGELVFEKLVSALRSVAAKMDLVDIHANREEFASAVHEMVRTDLEEHNGITLEAVTISRLDQTDPQLLSDENIFDAQGKEKITEITADARVRRNELEREAERAMEQKNVETRKRILALQKEQAEAEATQTRDIANIRAERKREQEQYQIEQDRLVQETEIAKERSVQEARIQREQAIREAEIARDMVIIQREQERDQADIARQKAVEVAERERQIAVALKDAERARAEAEALQAQADREQAEQQVLTVQAVAQAEREYEVRMKQAQQVIDQDKYRQQTEAEVAAYARVKQAEAEQEAAEKQAQARLRLAEAEADARKLQAEGEQALKMVDVQVERERVNVERARVEVERQDLENKQTFERAAIEFETNKLRIEAEKEVRVALAQAIGEFMSRGEYRIFGDPTTMSQMMTQMSRGLGFGTLAEGILAGAPEGTQEVLEAVARRIRDVAPAIAERLVGPGDGGASDPEPEEPAVNAEEEPSPEEEPPAEEEKGEISED
ncbi:MAG TPA: hypothetical protein EYP85_10910 [Armatimonadetes bacterium]|nr:hypothetical protein [Armatimonadota bacterium]